MLTQNELKKHLSYNPQTGIFIHLIASKTNQRYVGKPAGSIESTGYSVITINKQSYKAHRLAWLHIHGFFPEEIDHINHIRNDNRYINLRAVTHKENHKNRKKEIRNTSGITGISYHTTAKKWCVYIKVRQKQLHYGAFNNKYKAIAVRKAIEVFHGFHSNHGI